MPWQQNYDPLHGVLSTLAAVLPLVILLGLLALRRVPAHIAALAGLATALAVAVGIIGMPTGLAGRAALLGAAYGVLPIGWIVLNVMFLYRITEERGVFVALQGAIARVTDDRRLQLLLIAFCFGAFFEGAAGFGTPVAVTGAMLIGLGFPPLEASALSLIANTAPVAFGALGTPLLTLAKVTGLGLQLLSMMVGRQLAIFSVIVPFWLVAAQAGWRGMIGVWPACLVSGLSFAIAQFLMSNYHGPWLVGIVAAVTSMGSLVVLMRFWKPAEEQSTASDSQRITTAAPAVNAEPAWKAWLPWIFLTVFVFTWGLPPVKQFLDGVFAPGIQVPFLHNAVQRVPPVVAKITSEAAVFDFKALSATGTALLLAGCLAGLCLGLDPKRIWRIYLHTLWRVRVSLLTIALMLALGYTTRFSGTDTTMGLALATTGFLFPFFSPLIGWLGVALTGSDTSSNVLFGNLQQVTAQQLNLSPVLMASSNSSGGVMGKMIDAQSIVVASVATGGHPDSPDAGTVLRSVFWHSLALAILMGVLVMLQAYVFRWMIPTQ
jgi:lactate permease